MAKTKATKHKDIKYGNVTIPKEDFSDENTSIRVSMMLPVLLIKDLKKLSLTEEHMGKYQPLIRDILLDYVERNKKPARKRA